MSLERGTYGIEYDQNRKSSFGKLWLLPVVIPLVVIVLVLRGCVSGKSNRIYSSDETAPEERLTPEVAVERERPSIAVHFLQAWRSKFKGDSPSAAGVAAPENGSAPTVPTDSGGGRRTAAPAVREQNIPDAVARLLTRVKELEDGGDLVSARMILQKLRLRPDAAGVRGLVEKRIGEINIALIFSGSPMPGKLLHKIQSGDLVSKLARRYDNTEEYILRVNKIEHPEKIRIGQELWVLDHPVFELMIDKSDFKAVILFNHGFFKVYTVGLGDPGSTPAGTYEVRSRSAGGEGRDCRIGLRAVGDTPAVASLTLSGAVNESHLGMISQASGVMFSQAGMEELWALLPAGSMVTIVE